MSIRFDARVAIVTGAGAGLGRAHALGLAARGAKVVVNDLGVAADGTRAASDAAESVVEEIRAGGGEAVAHGGDVSSEADMQDLAKTALDQWGRIDILVSNAGILRDKSFGKMEMADFRKVVDVHLIGAANIAHACWGPMRERKYGRIVFTSSASGLYGNFGQSNYGAAKAGLMGLMNVLHLEGARDDIRVNLLAPTAATRMTEGLLPPEAAALLAPETITPGLLWLVSEDAPSRTMLAAGAGCFARTRIYETEGVTLTDPTPEAVAAAVAQIDDPRDQRDMPDAFSQTRAFARNAARARGLDLNWEG